MTKRPTPYAIHLATQVLLTEMALRKADIAASCDSVFTSVYAANAFTTWLTALAEERFTRELITEILPNPPGNQENPFQNTPNFDDGVDEPTGKGTMRVAQGFGGTGQGYAGSPEETELLNSMMAPSLGVSPERVDDLGALLVGPMARGAEVGYR